MKRFALIAAITAGLLWNASTASAQYPPYTARSQTMTGRNLTMSGQFQTNHNHLIPRSVTSNYPPYYSGGMILPTGGYPLGGYSYNPPVWSGPVYPSGGYGWWSYGR